MKSNAKPDLDYRIDRARLSGAWYAPFYSLIRCYVNKKISKPRLILEWKMLQEKQGVVTTVGGQQYEPSAPRT